MSNQQDAPGYGLNPNAYPPNYPPVTIPPTVVVTNAVVNYGPEPQRVACPYCHATITTKVESSATTKTHISALLLCCCLCWPCAWLPYCMDSCQSTSHYCPSCNAFLGSYGS